MLLWFPLLFAACSGSPSQVEEEGADEPTSARSSLSIDEDQARLAGISWGQPSARVLSAELECTGAVEVPPYSLGSVYSPVNGWVKEVRYLPGQYVRKGQRLTVLEHPDIIRLQRQLLTSASQLAVLEKDFERKKLLAGTEAASRRSLEQAEAAYEQERLQFEGLKAELNIIGIPADPLLESREIQPSLVVRSPVSGYLHTVNINLGKLVQPEELLFEIVDIRHVHLELRVYAKDLSRMKEGLPVEAYLPGSDSTFQAEVYLIGRMVDPQTKTALVHAHFKEEPVPITPGTYMHAHIKMDAHEVTTLPQTAFVQEAERSFVFVRQQDVISRREVRTGLSGDGYTEVIDLQLPEGAEVALKGAYYLNGQLAAMD